MAKRKSGGSPFWLAVLALGVLGLAVSWAWTTFGGRDPGTRRSGHHVVRVHALAHEQVVPQVKGPADAGAGPPADHDRFDLGHFPFLIIGEA